MSNVFLALIAIIAPITAAAIGYFVAKLTNSGRINTSTADRLWQESTDMRKELAATVERQDATITAQAEQIAHLTTEAAVRDAENAQLQIRLTTAENTIAALREQIGLVLSEQQRRRDLDEPRPAVS